MMTLELLMWKWQGGLASCFFIANMSAIHVKKCILHGKNNNNLTFIAQKTAGETPLESGEKGDFNATLIFWNKKEDLLT
jgi:hypothetical protein